MNLNLQHKNALVCGSSKGIGKATAIALAQLGANVTLVARNADRLSDVKNELDKSQKQQHNFLAADFSNIEDLRRKVTGLVSRKPIHILINNTGGPPTGPITDADETAFSQAFNKHLVCNHLLANAVIKGMKKESYGRIINIISTSVKQPLSNFGVSNTIRGAVANWAKTLANELGPFGITVNNVLPGSTETERLQQTIQSKMASNGLSEEEVIAAMTAQIPLRRFAQPSEIGEAVAYLASPAAAYITGTNLTIDGGRTKSL